MKTRILSLLPLVVSCLISSVLAQDQITVTIPEGFADPGQLFIVKNSADTPDADPGDRRCADSNGNCTLRAAIDESNANNAPADVIIFELAYPAVIELTEGPLNISDTATSILGPGARRLIVRRNTSAAPFRIFNVTNADDRSRTLIRGLRLEGGFAGNFIAGGAVRVGPGATLDMAEMWLAGNTAGGGGAISNEGTLNITRSLFSDNSASADGGAIHLSAGSSLVLTNSTLTSNSAAAGGAIYAAGSLLSANNTITHNSATVSASSIASASGSSVSVMNTIIGADVSSPVTSISGAFNSLGNNIVTDARLATGFTNGVNNDQVSNSNAIDPLLGPLADNGGQTDTRALLVNSPAIDRGNSCVYDRSCTAAIPRLRWDQRTNHSRRGSLIPGVVDVGAFESGSVGSSSSTGIFAVPVGNRRRVGFVFAINTSTGERRVAILNLQGGYRFINLTSGDAWVLDHHIKRGPQTPSVIAFDF